MKPSDLKNLSDINDEEDNEEDCGSDDEGEIGMKFWGIFENLKIKMENTRMNVKTMLGSSYFGKSYSILLLGISLLSPMLYISELYLKPWYGTNIIEKLFASIIVLDWCLAFFIADRRWQFVFRFVCFISLFTEDEVIVYM